MRFLHAADIHLDSPLVGLSLYDGSPAEKLRAATRQAFVQLIDYTLENEIDFLLLAGDLYDGNWPDYNTGLFFTKQITRLVEAQIPVIGIWGNHDAQSQITKHLRLPPGVNFLSVDEPETLHLADKNVAIHGQGFKHRAMTDDLSATYPPPVDGCFNIGLLHTSADGRPGHDNYAPCSVERLKNHGYDYWALGHIHQREILNERPYIVFPGNLQGRHARETGPKGATLVTLVDGAVDTLEHIHLDVARWQEVTVDITGLSDPDDVRSEVLATLEETLDECGERILAARVTITGESPLHSELVAAADHWVNEIRNLSIQIGIDRIWIEKVKIRSRTEIDVQKIADQHDAFASLLEGLDSLRKDPEQLLELGRELFSKLEGKLPPEWRAKPGEPIATSRELLEEALGDIPHILASELQAIEDNS